MPCASGRGRVLATEEQRERLIEAIRNGAQVLRPRCQGEPGGKEITFCRWVVNETVVRQTALSEERDNELR